MPSLSSISKAVVLAVGAAVLICLALWFVFGSGDSGAVTIQVDGNSDLVVRNISTEEQALPDPGRPGIFALSAQPGELLQVRGGGFNLYYRYGATERRPLVFKKSGFRMYLNDRLVGLDLSSLAARRWLAEADKNDVASVCTILLQGELAGLVGLEKLPVSMTCVLPAETLSDVAGKLAQLSLHGLVLLGSGRNEELEKLDLSVLSEFAQLRVFSMMGCEFSGDLTPLQELTEMEFLTVQGCQSISDIGPVAKLQNLRVLHLAGCPLIKHISPMASLLKLRSVDLRGCDGIEDLSQLSQCSLVAFKAPSQISGEELIQLMKSSSELKTLSLESCDEMADFQFLAHAPLLASLSLPVTVTDSQLQALSHVPNLRYLDLRSCGEITNLAVLASLSELSELDISGCGRLSDLSALAECSHLTSLAMAGCPSIKDLSDVGKLSHLEQLNMATCENVGDLSPLSSLTSLRRLRLGADYGSGVGGLRFEREGDERFPPCESFENLQPLAKLTNLRRLDILSCPKLTDVSALRSLTELKSLSLVRCFRLRDISALSGLQQLEELRVIHGEGILDLSPLSTLKKLRRLDAGAPSFLSGGDQVRDIAQIAKLRQLQELSLTCCDGVSDLAPLAALTNLRDLDLFGCQSVHDITPLEGLSNLQFVNLAGCGKIKQEHRQALRDAVPLATVVPRLPPEPPEPPSRKLSPEEEQLRRDHMDEALALIPATFASASVSFTREGGQDISESTKVSDRIQAAIDMLRSQGCARGLLPAARHTASKPDIVKFFFAEIGGGRPQVQAIREKIGEPDRTETAMQKVRNEFAFEFEREVEKEVRYHIYGWVHFGELDGEVRFIRVDCTRLPEEPSP